MQKSIRLSDFHYPYVILIFKFLHYFEVDIKEELAEIIKPSSEINSESLSKMGFTKIGGRWVSKDGGQVGPSGTNMVMNLKLHQLKRNPLLRLKRLVLVMITWEKG